ncbi:hypothetical protein OBBRIDRAFT_791382 [Obba rivulosa]|uniref:Uncharacterized protein n=1 Tax=Obba rivulosa TaxID=1052685 RepID=A0A8E2B4M0_9APHY|nr:hypothetical protein OBBRIDRAFT_791382 [Obba rivulosa]
MTAARRPTRCDRSAGLQEVFPTSHRNYAFTICARYSAQTREGEHRLLLSHSKRERTSSYQCLLYLGMPRDVAAIAGACARLHVNELDQPGPGLWRSTLPLKDSWDTVRVFCGSDTPLPAAQPLSKPSPQCAAYPAPAGECPCTA